MTSLQRFLGLFGATTFLSLISVGVHAAPAEASAPREHHLEVLAEGGFIWPPSDRSDVRRGFELVGGAYYHLGQGWSLGAVVDWSRLPWTPNEGAAAHVDSLMIGPEVRWTLNRHGLILPHAYLGIAAYSDLSPSRDSVTSTISGGPVGRLGLGVDVRVLPQLRLGLSAGWTLASLGTSGNLMYVAGDPGVPSAIGVWSLRVGGRGEFL